MGEEEKGGVVERRERKIIIVFVVLNCLSSPKTEKLCYEMGVYLPEGAVVGCDDESDSALHCSRLKEDILVCGRGA